VGTAERGSAPRFCSIRARVLIAAPAFGLPGEQVFDHLGVGVGVMVGDVAGSAVAEAVSA
jgi:hypothetical protein